MLSGRTLFAKQSSLTDVSHTILQFIQSNKFLPLTLWIFPFCLLSPLFDLLPGGIVQVFRTA